MGHRLDLIICIPIHPHIYLIYFVSPWVTSINWKADPALTKEGPAWIWKDGKGGYQEFLGRLQPDQKNEVVEK